MTIQGRKQEASEEDNWFEQETFCFDCDIVIVFDHFTVETQQACVFVVSVW